MARGDHFFVWRNHQGIPFQHHVIDLGDGQVVHFTDGDGGVAGPGGTNASFEIKRTTIQSVTRDGRDSIHVVAHSNPFAADVIAQRALGQVGRRGYHLLFDNCEHFACWCAVGRNESRQVTVACERLSAFSVKAIATGTVHVVGKASARHFVRGASPWMLCADAAQWMTEAAGHHLGLRDPRHRKRAGQAVGAATALGVGACGGPAGLLVAGGLWAAGELAGEVSRVSYEGARKRRRR